MTKPPINSDDILAELSLERRAEVLERGCELIAEERTALRGNQKHVNNISKLIMHRLIARAIGRDPPLVEKARDVLAQSGGGYSFVGDWNAILALPVSEVRRLLISRSENMTRLRLSSPFALVIDLTDPDLRRRIHRAARRLVEHGLAEIEPPGAQPL